jgi:hypothetical protein
VADLDGSWSAVQTSMRALLTLAQARAATDGVRYVPQALAAQGITPDPAAVVDPSKLAGVASSGYAIDALLDGPLLRVKALIGGGLVPDQAMTQGRALLDGIVTTQIADAGRVGAGLATVADHAAGGYTRMLVRPSCSRCVVLAGKFYGPLSGFARHPRCDCIHVPTVESVANDLTVDPQVYFDTLNTAGQDSTFGQAGAQAIRDGADIGQVVNARKGVYTASAYGRTVRATHANSRGTRGPRLMPEQIYRDATDRADAVRLLRRYGYLT